MADDFVKFRKPGEPKAPAPESDPRLQLPVYQRALELSKAVFDIVELAETERYFLRDQLDKKSTAIPVTIAQALGTANMFERRELFGRAKKGLTELTAILDVLAQRATVEPEVLDLARGIGRELGELLAQLTVEPPRVR